MSVSVCCVCVCVCYVFCCGYRVCITDHMTLHECHHQSCDSKGTHSDKEERFWGVESNSLNTSLKFTEWTLWSCLGQLMNKNVTSSCYDNQDNIHFILKWSNSLNSNYYGISQTNMHFSGGYSLKHLAWEMKTRVDQSLTICRDSCYIISFTVPCHLLHSLCVCVCVCVCMYVWACVNLCVRMSVLVLRLVHIHTQHTTKNQPY